MKQVAVLMILVSLSGCSSFSANHFANSKHLTGDVKDELFSNKSQFFKEYKDALDCTSSCDDKYKDYRDKGVALVKSSCEDELDSLANKHNNHNAGKDLFIASTLLATGMMGINGASSSSFEKLALGSAFTITMLDIRENYYLLGPDRIEIIEMIRTGLAKMEISTMQKDVLSFENAYSQIRDVAYICTNNQIDSLVRESLNKGKDSLSISPIADANLTQSYNKISEILNARPLSDNQLLGMYAYVRLGESIDSANTDSNGIKALLGSYSTAPPTAVQSRKIAEIYSRLPKAITNKFTEDYKLVKAKAQQANNAAVPGVLSSSDIDFTLPTSTSSSLQLKIAQ